MGMSDREAFIDWWESRHYDNEDREVKKASWCAWKAAREQEGGEAVAVKDAYDGAREDLQIWKKRALESEKLLQEEIESNARLVEVCNDLTGPTHMGEPVLPPRQGAQEAKPIAYTNGSQLFYLWDEEGEGKMFAEREGDYDIALYTRPPQSQGVPEGWRSVIQGAIDELGIMDESEGVAGWHLNGAIASWDESGLPAIRDALVELISTPAAPQADEWVKCSQRLPKPRSVSRTAKNGILVKFDNGRITQFREVSETLISNMRNGPRQPMKFESPNPAGIVEWMDLDESQQPPEQEDGV